MERSWAFSLTPERAAELEREYKDLLDREKSLSAEVSAEAQDAYTELVGFPARVLAKTGLIFLADGKIQMTNNVAANEEKIAQLRKDLDTEVENFNTKIAGGKWNRMMPGLVTGRNLMAWNSQLRWPWGEPADRRLDVRPQPAEQNWRDAARADRQTSSASARWTVIEGLDPSGHAMALKPASIESSWSGDDTNAPALEFEFTSKAGDAEALVDFLPTFRIHPGMKLQAAVSVDDGAPTLVEVPGSSGAESETGRIRSQAIQNNFVRARIPLPGLAAGSHTFVIRAVDPGAVIDRVWLS